MWSSTEGIGIFELKPLPAAVVGMLAACAGGSAGEELPSAAFVGAEGAPGENYIGPLDEFTVFVWRNPELGAEVQVRPDDRITTPLMSDLPAVAARPRSSPTTSRDG